MKLCYESITVLFFLMSMFYQLNAQTYCTSGATSLVDSEIHHVTLFGDTDTIDNNTIGLTTLYNYYSSQSADVSGSNVYSLSVLLGTTGATQYGKSAAVYIDWNNDGDFNDPNEFIGYIGPFAFGVAPVTETLTFDIPANAVVGVTRLRVVCAETTTLSALGPCNTVTYGETEDYNIEITSLPACPNPLISGVADITNNSADLEFISGASAVATNISIGAPGFTPGSGTQFIASSSPFSITDLNQNTSYQVYVQNVCAANELSSWVGPLNFTTLADNVIQVTYTDGDIPTIFEASPGPGSVISSCAGSLIVDVPEGFWITSVDVTYQMSAQNGAWMGEQRSRIWSPTGNVGENQYYSGNGNAAGIFTYNRTNLSEFFGLFGEVEFLLDAKRTWTATQPNCETYHNYVVNNSWVLSIALDSIPDCIPPIGLSATLQGPNSAWLSYNSISDTVNIIYGPAGFDPAMSGTLLIGIQDNPYLLEGLNYNETYDFYIQSDCGPVDGLSDFTGPAFFTTECQAIVVTAGNPSCEDFENSGLMPVCWNQGANNNGSKNWQFSNTPSGNLGLNGQFAGSSLSGGYFAWVNDAAPHLIGTTLISPYYDISAITFPQLTFHTIRHAQTGNPVDYRVELNNGSGWQEIYFSNANVYPWEQIIVNLDSVVGSADLIRLRFIVDENNAFNVTDNIAIDDVCIRQAPLNDLGVITILNPGGATCNAASLDTVSAIVYNFGANAQTIFRMLYSLNGGTPVEEFYNSTINPGEEIVYSFDQLLAYPGPGEHELKVWSRLLSGQADEFPANDTVTIIVNIIPEIDELPYFENFESGSSGWTSGGAGTLWQVGVPASGALNTAFSGINAAVTNLTGQYTNNTQSYFMGPCFDFSDLDTDPVIEFAMRYITENCCDGFWIERSIDGGENWAKIPASPISQNWYNNTTAQRWNGNNGGWQIAKSIVQDVAGEPDVRIRFFFQTDISVVNDGIAIDDVFIYEPVGSDVMPLSFNVVSPTACFGMEETVNVVIINNGSFDLDFSVDALSVNLIVSGSIPQILTTTLNSGLLESLSTMEIPFTVDLSVPGTYQFTAITNLTGDQLVLNDTLSQPYATPPVYEVPFIEDFEEVPNLAALTASGWTSVGGGAPNVYAQGAHTLPTRALSYNLYGSGAVSQCTLTTPDIGPLPDSSFIVFDYRYVNWSAGTVPTVLGADSLQLQISSDCGVTWETAYVINQMNHITSTEMANVSFPVFDLEEETIRFRLIGHRAQGDYWLDLDNIGIVRPWNYDVMPIEIVDPSPGFTACGHMDNEIHIAIMNMGQLPVADILVEGYVEKDGVNWPLSGVITDTILPGEMEQVFVGSFNSLEGGDYEVMIYTTFAMDQYNVNDTMQRSISTHSMLPPEIFPITDEICVNASPMLIAVPENDITTFNWYVTETDTMPIFTGDTFVTPALTGPVTYYLGAESSENFSAGKPFPVTTPNTAGNAWGLVFDVVTDDIILESVDIYSVAGGGSISVVLADNAGNTIETVGPFTFPAGTTDVPTVVTLELNLEIPVGSDYRLLSANHTGNLIRETTGNAYPFISDNGKVAVTSGFIGGPGSATYYWFYNWQIKTGNPCDRPKTAIELNPESEATPAFTFQSDNLSVQFTNNSENATNYIWDFGDGNGSTSVNPDYQYSAPGTYNVCLTAINECGDATECNEVTVICQTPTAAFSFEQNGAVVSFENSSSLADSYEWDFGDGNASTDINPVHTYESSGEYTVCLTAINSCDEIIHCETVSVMVSVFDAIVPGSFKLLPNPNDGRFNVALTLKENVALEIEITDILGSAIAGQTVYMSGDASLPFDLSGQAAGIYFIKIKVNGTQHLVQTFVLQ